MPQTAPISVAIPVYNGSAFLAEAIQAVQRQTVAPTEVRVFDNASTDDSRDIATDLLGPGSLITSEQNLGSVENFNRAARTATQPLFMWLSADDRIAPTFIEETSAILENEPDAPACLTGVQFIDDHGAPLWVQADSDLSSPIAGTRLRPFLRRRRWTEFYCVYRTDALLRSPLAMADHGSDVLLTWWFLLRGPLAVTTRPLLEYRIGTPKSIDDITEAITPGAARKHWLKLRMWLALWRMTAHPDIAREVRRAARRELILLPIGTAWWFHLAEDMTLRWPTLRRFVGRFISLPTTARPRRVPGARK